MDEEVMYKHQPINQRVCEALGIKGRQVGQRLFDIATVKGVIPAQQVSIFVD